MAKINIKMKGRMGLFLLGIWLILNGLIGLLSLHFEGLSMIMAVLAGVSGVLIILGL